VPVHDVPPELGEALSWRELWRSRGFALLELVPDSVFSSLAADRGLRLGIGQAPLEELDVQGVLQPVARVDLDVLRAPAEQRDKVMAGARQRMAPADEGPGAPAEPLPSGVHRPVADAVRAAQKILVDPWPEVLSSFDAQAAASELGVSAAQLSKVYWFLVERGIDREPRDGLELLRRARPRSAQKHVQGLPRRGQDLFDAAQVLWLFLRDLTGNPPERNRLSAGSSSGMPGLGLERTRAHQQPMADRPVVGRVTGGRGGRGGTRGETCRHRRGLSPVRSGSRPRSAA
jgi:hypothetical protein